MVLKLLARWKDKIDKMEAKLYSLRRIPGTRQVSHLVTCRTSWSLCAVERDA